MCSDVISLEIKDKTDTSFKSKKLFDKIEIKTIIWKSKNNQKDIWKDIKEINKNLCI